MGFSGDGHRPPPGASTQKCRGPTCTVGVSVGNDCTVTVDPEVLDLREGSGTQDITLKLLTDGYKFSDDPLKYAIVVKSDDSAGQIHSPSHQGTSVKVKFKHKNPGKYFEYGVNVVRDSDGQRCSTKDPWFIE
jgi:hypothetical protein